MAMNPPEILGVAVQENSKAMLLIVHPLAHLRNRTPKLDKAVFLCVSSMLLRWKRAG